MDLQLGMNAFWWGIASAVSLPLGAAIGMWWRPRRKLNSAFMAFGAGALLFALTIELFGHVPNHVEEHGWPSFLATLVGAISGGLLFDLLNSILNDKGAFLRKLSIARRYVGQLKVLRKKRLIEELSKIEVLRHLEPEKMALLVHRVVPATFKKGEKIFSQGDEALYMYFICSGEVEVLHHGKDGSAESIAILREGGTFGEIGVLGGFTRTADIVAKSDVRVYKISKEDVAKAVVQTPELKEALDQLSADRVDSMEHKGQISLNKAWRDQTMEYIEASNVSVELSEIQEEAAAENSKGGAAVAIWLGILIDGIPESLVIGMLAASQAGMSLAFVAGVFLANLPEAMSSAVSMRAQGMKLKKIYLMWGSICVLTGIGAFIGATMFPANPQGSMFYLVLGIEGLAAGAMLTMIAETMLPEAFEQGGTIVGLSTLGGFLAALFVKVM